MSRTPKITAETVAAIRERGARILPWGAQKVIAYDFGISPQHVCQILKGMRRKATRRVNQYA